MAVEAAGAVPVAQPQKKTGGSGKALASTFIPGLGQFLDGRNKEGAGYMAGCAALSVGQYALAKNYMNLKSDIYVKEGFEALKKVPKGKWYGAIALGLAGTALWIANIVDAYKGKKS